MRKSLAGLVLGLSLVLATVAWAGFTMSHTVLDPARSERLADQLFDNEQLRGALVDRLTAGMTAALPAEAPTVPDQLLRQAADRALDDPSVQALVREGIVKTHRNALEGNVEPVTIDASALGSSTRAALVEVRPELDSLLPQVPPVAITLPTSGLSKLGAIKDFVDRFTFLAAAVALAGAVVSLIVTSDRPAVLRRVASWAFGAAGFWLVVAFGLPWLANRIAPTSAAIITAIIDVFFGAMIPPAITMAFVGAALLGGSFLWSAISSRQGANALQPRRASKPKRLIQSDRPAAAQSRPSMGSMSNVRSSGPASPVTRPAPIEPGADATLIQPGTIAKPTVRQGPGTKPPMLETTHAPPHPEPTVQPPPTAPNSPPTAEGNTAPTTRWVEGVGYVEESSTEPPSA